MALETTIEATGVACQLGSDEAGPRPDTSRRPASVEAIHPQTGAYFVLWDEVDPGAAGPWPKGGTLLFLWPHLQGDLRRPAWARHPGDAEDEYASWWNLEDSKVSAALLLPFFADLLAFLSRRAGPARFEFHDRFQVARSYLRRLVPGLRPRPIPDAALARSEALEQLVGLVEGAGRSDRSACTVTFGAPGAAILHARREERCLWLWLAPGVRESFYLFRDHAGVVRFLRHVMDWSGSGSGMPAPPLPRALGR